MRSPLALIDRFGKFFDFSWKTIEIVEKRFTEGKKDEFLIFITRAIPVIPVSLISATCGFLLIPPVEFLLFTFLGIVVRSFVLAFLGWQVGEVYHDLASGIGTVESVVTIFLLVLTAVVFGFFYLKREKILNSS